MMDTSDAGDRWDTPNRRSLPQEAGSLVLVTGARPREEMRAEKRSSEEEG